MEKKKVNVSLASFALTVLLVIAIMVIVVMGMMMNKLSSEKEIAETKVSELESSLSNVEGTVNNLQGKLETISNTLSDNNANQSSNDSTANPTETKKTDEEIVKELFMNQLKEWNDERDANSADKWMDYKIESVKIITGSERKVIVDEFFANANSSDIFAEVTCSVKPKDISRATLAGDGQIKGEWIEHTLLTHISENSGTYKLESAGTGW